MGIQGVVGQAVFSSNATSPIEKAIAAVEKETGEPFPREGFSMIEFFLSHATITDYTLEKEGDLKNHHILVLNQPVTGTFYRIGEMTIPKEFAWITSSGFFSEKRRKYPCTTFTFPKGLISGTIGFWPFCKKIELVDLRFDAKRLQSRIRFQGSEKVYHLNKPFSSWNDWCRKLTFSVP